MKKLFTLLLLFAFTGASAQVRISQIYGGGGNSGATYTNDFVELFNAGTTAADISNHSIQYASATGSSWQVVSIPDATSIPAGGYYLIGLGGSSTGIALPTTDHTGTINMSGTAGKVAFVNSVTALVGSGACAGVSVVDVVGFGLTASCSEFTNALTTGIDNTKSVQRKNAGCLETDNNGNDFEVLAVNPRNSSSPLNLCGAAGPIIIAAPSSISTLSTLFGQASASEQIEISGTNLTGFPGNISATASSTNIQVSNDNNTWGSSTSVSYAAATLSATPIYVRISGTAPLGNVNELISINGGGISTSVDVSISGNVTLSAPTVQASNIVVSNISDNGFDVNWTNGNGAERIVVVRPTSSTQVLPSDGTVYTAPGTLGSANDIVFAGSGAGPVTVSGLSTGTSYTIHVYEYNGTTGTSNYLTTTANNNPFVVSTTGITNTLQQGYFTGESVPLFMASGSSTRLPTMYIATVSGLAPNTIYRYYTQAAATTDFGNSVTGAGASILIDYTVTPATFSISSSGSVTSDGNYGKFTTDATGSFTGTFGFTQTGNARFNAGSLVYPSLAISEDANPSPIQYRFALDQAITSLSFGTAADATSGTLLQGNSLATAGNLVAVWQSVDGSSLLAARPLSMTIAETLTFASGSWFNLVPGYISNTGDWNTIIPNQLPTGVRLIQQMTLEGDVVGCSSDADGVWPNGGTITVNPAGGSSTPILIESADGPINTVTNCATILPVTIHSFDVQKLGNSSKMTWATEQEFNSLEFVIERSANQSVWTPIGTVAAAGHSEVARHYSFVDASPVRGINFYRLRVVDQDLKSQYSETKSLLFNINKSVLISPNPANSYVNIYLSETGNTQVIISDLNGKRVEKIQTTDSQVRIHTSRYAAGIYIVTIINAGQITTQKLVVQ